MTTKTYILLLALFVIGGGIKGQDRQVSFRDLDSMAASMKKMVYKQTEEGPLKMLYRLPTERKKNKNYPAIVFIHGGAWMGGTAETLAPYAAYFSLRNMVGISIEYRLLINEHSDILNCIADCKSAIRFIKSHYRELQVDTSNIIISGESAGGHLAACMELLDGYNDPADNTGISVKPSAMILLNPVVNLTTNNFIKYLDARLVKIKQPALDSATLANRYFEKAKSISPLFQLKKALPPTLLINGEKDITTPASYAISFSKQANAFVNNCSLLLIPETGHAFAVPHYKEPEQKAVNTILAADTFLQSIRILSGAPMIVNGNDPNWIHKR